MARFVGMAGESKKAKDVPVETQNINQEPDYKNMSLEEIFSLGKPKQELEQYRGVVDPATETGFQKVLRNLGGAAQDIWSTGAGLAGSIAGGPAYLAEKGAEALGFPLLEPEKFESEKWGIPKEKYLESLEKIKPKDYKPTLTPIIDVQKAKDIWKGAAEETFNISPEYWESKTPAESDFRRTVSSAATYLNPLFGPIGLARSVITPIAGLAVRKGAKLAGAPEWLQETLGGITELGALTYNPKGLIKRMDKGFETTNRISNSVVHNAAKEAGILDKAVKELGDPKTYTRAEKFFKNQVDHVKDLISNNPTAKPLKLKLKMFEKKIGHIKNLLKNKNIKPEKSRLLEKTRSIIEEKTKKINDLLMKNKNISIKEALGLKRKLSEHAWDESRGNPEKLKYLKPQLKKLNDMFNGLFESYGKTASNPAWLKAYKDSNSIYMGLNNMMPIVKGIEKTYKKKAGVLGAALLFGKVKVGKLIGYVGLAKGIKDLSKAGNALWNSKSIRNFYWKGLGLASKNKFKEASVAFQKMEKGLEEEFPGITAAMEKEAGSTTQAEPKKGTARFAGMAKT